jgi:hypothetical protein
MSDITVISKQYEKLVATSDSVNYSVIIVKKKSLLADKTTTKRYPRLKLESKDVDSARTTLISFLSNLTVLIQKQSKESEYLPSLIQEDYLNRLTKRNQYISEDIDQLMAKLKKGENIEEDGIRVLDELLSVLDTERGNLFRKLRTARG